MPKQPAQKPDNTAVKQDGGYYFPAWRIHVVADTLAEAKAHIKEHHGRNVDKETPPPLQETGTDLPPAPSE